MNAEQNKKYFQLLVATIVIRKKPQRMYTYYLQVFQCYKTVFTTSLTALEILKLLLHFP